MKFTSLLGKNGKCFALTLTIGILFSAIGVILPVVSGEVINAFCNQEAGRINLLLVFVGISVLDILFYALDRYAIEMFSLKQQKCMRHNIFSSVIGKRQLSNEEKAETTSFINNDMPDIVEQFFVGTIDIIKCCSIILFSTVSMLSIHWIEAIIIVVISVLMVLLPKTMSQMGKTAKKESSGALARYNTVLQSFLGGIPTLHSYCYAERAKVFHEKVNAEVLEKSGKVKGVSIFIQSGAGFLQVLETVLILVSGVLLISNGRMSIGGLVAVIQLGELIGAPIEVLSYLLNGRNSVKPLVEQYEGMLLEIQEFSKDTVGKTRFIRGDFTRIEVKDLSYAINETMVLKHLNLNFEKGKKYLVKGSSGCGKSTLLRLLAQSGDLQYSGEIACDGVDVKQMDEESYCCNVAMVYQDTYLFYATMEENIKMGRDISDDLYKEVIGKLNLSYLLERYASQDIDANIIECLSGGEKQRIALARAMVGQPMVYLLDEVTSALDEENAENVERMLLENDATVIHVCHKINRAMEMKYNVVMEF